MLKTTNVFCYLGLVRTNSLLIAPARKSVLSAVQCLFVCSMFHLFTAATTGTGCWYETEEEELEGMITHQQIPGV